MSGSINLPFTYFILFCNCNILKPKGKRDFTPGHNELLIKAARSV